ncbi:NitT/TauT family transport system permease protein [Nitrobacteraceae bacterium AZCC 2161]
MSQQKPMRRRSRWIDQALPPAIILAILLLAWQGSVRALDLPPWLLPAPSDIAARFGRTASLGYHTGMTVLEALAGFVISAALGVCLSAGIVHSRFLESGLLPYIVVANAIPVIAIMPLLTIWFGFGIAPKIMICALISFFPIVTNTTRGLRAADPRIIELMHSVNATSFQVFAKVQLPSALPFIFAGFKIAASLALVGAVVAEFYSSDRGLGYLIITSATELRTDLLFVAITILAILGVVSFLLFGRLERWATRGEGSKAII